ncbi:probable polygalacturonase At3g15720 [Typha latifolia]|uniref:probable polygalacturonase At3g15720 n=1 Tax=Typha latifolia TaxID=4733 RepID=UPI003C2F4BB7
MVRMAQERSNPFGRVKISSNGSLHSIRREKETIAGVIGLWFALAVQLATSETTYDVLAFKAVGDGETNDTQAFLKTWEAACADPRYSTFLVPAGRTFLLSRILFYGPCKSGIHFQLSGNIVAPNSIWTTETTNLVAFFGVNSLTVDGGGQIDGRGAIWWECVKNILQFLGCNDLTVKGIHLTNGPSKHMTFYHCIRVHVSGVTVTAPGNSPNTDGFLVSASQYVEITACSIGTGDDCIAIGPGSSKVNISRITCGPGHGISVGSLGKDGSTALVEQIFVSDCNIFQALTGTRIKTWQGGKGYARNIVFQHINMTSVQIPIDIDQFYCPQAAGCRSRADAVEISDVQFVDIHGTSSSEVAIDIQCSHSVPCRGITLNDITLKQDGKKAPATSNITNAYGTTIGTVIPPVHFA